MRNLKIGVIVNPIAGVGGPLGLGGSDSLTWLVEQEVRGPAYVRSTRSLRLIKKELVKEAGPQLMFLVGHGQTGLTSALEAGLDNIRLVSCYAPAMRYSRELANAMMRAGADIIVFFGGDGTAFDVAVGSAGRVPIVGVPSGTKMYNSIFVLCEEALPELLLRYAEGEAELVQREVFLVDEEGLRAGRYRVTEKTRALTIHVEGLHVFQGSKEAFEASLADVEGIAAYLGELYGFPWKGAWLVGPGGTLSRLLGLYGISKGFLGFLYLTEGRVMCRSCTSAETLRLLEEHPDTVVLLSPVGGSGFLIGRGNKELTPAVLRRLSPRRNLLVVATREKLARHRYLLVDTGDPELDALFEGYVRVITGYNEETVTKVLSARRVKEREKGHELSEQW